MWYHNCSCSSLHRRPTEDVGLWRGSRSVCAPGLYSVHGLLSVVSDSDYICPNPSSSSSSSYASSSYSSFSSFSSLTFCFYFPGLFAPVDFFRFPEQQLLRLAPLSGYTRLCQLCGGVDGPRRSRAHLHLLRMPAAWVQWWLGFSLLTSWPFDPSACVYAVLLSSKPAEVHYSSAVAGLQNTWFPFTFSI